MRLVYCKFQILLVFLLLLNFLSIVMFLFVSVSVFIFSVSGPLMKMRFFVIGIVCTYQFYGRSCCCIGIHRKQNEGTKCWGRGRRQTGHLGSLGRPQSGSHPSSSRRAPPHQLLLQTSIDVVVVVVVVVQCQLFLNNSCYLQHTHFNFNPFSLSFLVFML